MRLRDTIIYTAAGFGMGFIGKKNARELGFTMESNPTGFVGTVSAATIVGIFGLIDIGNARGIEKAFPYILGLVIGMVIEDSFNTIRQNYDPGLSERTRLRI